MYMYMGNKVCYDVSNTSFRPEEGIVAIGANASHEWLAILTQWHIEFRRCDHSMKSQFEQITSSTNVELESQASPEQKRRNCFAFPWSKAENECNQELLWHSTRTGKLIVAAQRRILFLCLNESLPNNEVHHNDVTGNNDVGANYNTNYNIFSSGNNAQGSNFMNRTLINEQTHQLHLSVEHELKIPSGLTMSVLHGNHVFFVLLTTTGVVYTIDWTNCTILHEWSTRILRKELLPCGKWNRTTADNSLTSTSFAEKEASAASSHAFSEDEECKRNALLLREEECEKNACDKYYDDHDKVNNLELSISIVKAAKTNTHVAHFDNESVCEANRLYSNREHITSGGKHSDNNLQEHSLLNYGQRTIFPPGSAVHRIKKKSVLANSDVSRNNLQVLAPQEGMLLPNVAAPHFIYFHSSPSHALHDTSIAKILSGAIIHVTFSAVLSLFAMVISSGAIVLVEYKNTENYFNSSINNNTINYDMDDDTMESEKSVSECKYRCGVNVLPSVASIVSINATHHLLVYCTLDGEVVCAPFTLRNLNINESLLWRSSCASPSLSPLSKSITSITWMSSPGNCKHFQEEEEEKEKLQDNDEEENDEYYEEEMCCVCYSNKTFALWHYSGVCTFCSTPLSSSSSSSAKVSSVNKVTSSEKSIQNDLTGTRTAVPATENSISRNVISTNTVKEKTNVAEHSQNNEEDRKRSFTPSFTSESSLSLSPFTLPSEQKSYIKVNKTQCSKSEYLLSYWDSLHQCLYLSVCQSHLLYTFSLGRAVCTAPQASCAKYIDNSCVAIRTAESLPQTSVRSDYTTITIMENNTLRFTEMENTSVHKRECLHAETRKIVANCTNFTSIAHLPQKCYSTNYPIRSALLNPFNQRFVICTAGPLTSDAQIIIYDRATDKWHLLSSRVKKICQSAVILCNCLPVWLDSETCVFAVALRKTNTTTTKMDSLEKEEKANSKKINNDDNNVVVEEEEKQTQLRCTRSSFTKGKTCQPEFVFIVCRFDNMKFDVSMCSESSMSSRPVHLNCIVDVATEKEVCNEENLFCLMCVDAEQTLHIFSMHLPKDTNKQCDLQRSNSKNIKYEEHKEGDNTCAINDKEKGVKFQISKVAQLRLPESLHHALRIWPVAINTNTHQAHLLVHRRQAHDMVQIKLRWNTANNATTHDNNNNNVGLGERNNVLKCNKDSSVCNYYCAMRLQKEHLSSSWVYMAWLDFNTPLEGVALITHDCCGFTFYHLPNLLTSWSEVTNSNCTNSNNSVSRRDIIDIGHDNQESSTCYECTVESLTTNSFNVSFSSSDLLCPIALSDHNSLLIGVKSFAIGTDGTLQHNVDMFTQCSQDAKREIYNNNDANRSNSINTKFTNQRNCFASVSYKACILSSILARSPAGNVNLSNADNNMAPEQENKNNSTSGETSEHIFVTTPSIRVVSSATLTWLRGQTKFLSWIDQLCNDGSFVSLMDYFIHSLIVDDVPAGIPNLHREAALHAFVLFLRNYDAFYTIIASCLRKMDSKGWDTFRDYVGSPVELFVECMELDKLNEAVQLLRRVLLDDVVNVENNRNVSHELATLNRPQTATNCALQLIAKLINQAKYNIAYDVVRFMCLLFHHWELPLRDDYDNEDNDGHDDNPNNHKNCNVRLINKQHECQEEEKERNCHTTSSHTTSVNRVTNALEYVQKIVASFKWVVKTTDALHITDNTNKVEMNFNSVNMPLRHDMRLVSHEETWHQIYETYPSLLEYIGSKSQEWYMEGHLISLMSLLHTFGFDTLACLRNAHYWTQEHARCAKMETFTEKSTAVEHENKRNYSNTSLKNNVCSFAELYTIMKGLYADLHLPLSTTRVSVKIAKLYRVNIKHVTATLKDENGSSQSTQCKEEWLLWLQQSTQSINWTLPQCVLYGANQELVHLLMTVRNAMEDDLCYQLTLSLLLMDKAKLIELLCVHSIMQGNTTKTKVQEQKAEPKMQRQQDHEENNGSNMECNANCKLQTIREADNSESKSCTNSNNDSVEVSNSASDNSSNSNNNINVRCHVKLSIQETTLQACKRETLYKMSLLEQLIRQTEFAGYHAFIQDVAKSLPPLLLETTHLPVDHAEEMHFIVSDSNSSKTDV